MKFPSKFVFGVDVEIRFALVYQGIDDLIVTREIILVGVDIYTLAKFFWNLFGQQEHVSISIEKIRVLVARRGFKKI